MSPSLSQLFVNFTVLYVTNELSENYSERGGGGAQWPVRWVPFSPLEAKKFRPNPPTDISIRDKVLILRFWGGSPVLLSIAWSVPEVKEGIELWKVVFVVDWTEMSVF